MRQIPPSSSRTMYRYRRSACLHNVYPQAHPNVHALTVMPSLSFLSCLWCAPVLRRTSRRCVAVALLAALEALPQARAATPPTTSAGTRAVAVPAGPAVAPSPKAAKTPTCESIMQRLSGSLAGTPSNRDKPGAVLVDVDKAGVTMACSHSDSIAIPVPGNGNSTGKTR